MTSGQKSDAVKPVGTVVVVGGGITGLSAAHELMERGFKVYVVEKARGLTRTGETELSLGGLAKTQYAFAPWIHDPVAMRSAEPPCPPEDGPLAPESAPRVWFGYHLVQQATFHKASFDVARSAAEAAVESVSAFVDAINRVLDPPRSAPRGTKAADSTPRAVESAATALNVAKGAADRLADAIARASGTSDAAGAGAVAQAAGTFVTATTRARDSIKALPQELTNQLPGACGSLETALGQPTELVDAARRIWSRVVLGASTLETLLEFTSRHVNFYPSPEITIRVFSEANDSSVRKSAYRLLEAEILQRYPDAKITMKDEVDNGKIPPRRPSDLGERPDNGDTLIIEMKSSLVPGEHGYRFFPAYYNHLRDLLQRIPILDDKCKPTNRTVFDNLVGSPYMGIASRKGDVAILQRLPGSGFRDRVQNWISTAAFAGTTRDVSQYVNRVLRYMTLCPERRIELADQSWIEYLIGRDPSRGGPLYCYSDDFLRNLAFAGRVLAALDNRWADARTAGDAFVQLTLSQISPQLKPDGVLNAPTTEAWFEPWRRWLEHGGVEFKEGELTGFKIDPASGSFDLDWAGAGPLFEYTPDYYLLATDLVSTQAIITYAGAGAGHTPDESRKKPEAWPLIQQAKKLRDESATARNAHERTRHRCRDRLREINDDLRVPLMELQRREREVDTLRAHFPTASDAERVKIKAKHKIAIDAISKIKEAQRKTLQEREQKRDELFLAERGVKAGDDADAGLRKVERFCVQLRSFACESFDPESGVKSERDPHTKLGEEPWDRLQTLSGVQFYFAHLFQVVDGHVYYVDAEWGLSAINPQQFWARRPTLAYDGFVSVMSVDVGSWRVPSRLRGGRRWVEDEIRDAPHATAWDLGELELADEVWRQIRTSLSFRHRPRDHWFNAEADDDAPPNSPGRLPRRLPRPVWFHIDEYLRYEFRDLSDKVLEAGRYLTRNDAPYLIPVKRDWRNRPGPSPWDPTVRDDWPRPPVKPVQTNSYWQGKGGGYPVFCEKIVFAGTWLKTFTRMTTMESANESARHAVNAILQHRVEQVEHAGARAETKGFPFGGGSFPTDDDLRSVGRRVDFGAQSVFAPTPLGDLCRIWDPEFNEADEFLPVRMLDLALFRAGMPPVWDVLGLHELPRYTPDFVDFVDRERQSDDPNEGARSPLAALQAFSRALGLPGVPMPPSTSYGSTMHSSPFGLEAVESLLHLAKQFGTKGSPSDPLELLRQLRVHLEQGSRRGHF